MNDKSKLLFERCFSSNLSDHFPTSPDKEAFLSFLDTFWLNTPFSVLTSKSPVLLKKISLHAWTSFKRISSTLPSIKIFSIENNDNPISKRTIIQIIAHDTSFISDSIFILLGKEKLKPYFFHNAIITHASLEDENTEDNFIHKNYLLLYAEIDCIDDNYADDLKKKISSVLSCVNSVTGDYLLMLRKTRSVTKSIPHTKKTEAVHNFLDWLIDDNFIFFGYQYISNEQSVFQECSKSRLGIPFENDIPTIASSDLDTVYDFKNDIICFGKASHKSLVHRFIWPDSIGIKIQDKKGNIQGVHRIFGLYTSVAASTPSQNIPLIDRKLQEILNRSGLDSNSFDGKTLRHVLNTYPKEELLQHSTNDLLTMALEITYAYARQSSHVEIREWPKQSFYSCVIFLPKNLYRSDLFAHLEDMIKHQLDVSDYYFDAQFGESDLLRMYYLVRINKPSINQQQLLSLKESILNTLSSWKEDIFTKLQYLYGKEQATTLAKLFLDNLPVDYKDYTPIKQVLLDFKYLSQVCTNNPTHIYFTVDKQQRNNEIHLKIFNYKKLIPLSNILPSVENFGFKVIQERTFMLDNPAIHSPIGIQGFLLTTQHEVSNNILNKLVADAMLGIQKRAVIDDKFNSLIIPASLTWKQINILRAYARYMKQINFSFDEQLICTALANHSDIASLLVEYFYKKFNPHDDNPKKDILTFQNDIFSKLDSIDIHHEDKIIRKFIELIDATVRTNFFQLTNQKKHKPYLAFKFNCKKIFQCPLPVPEYELFVFSDTIEGTHLRNGKIARGGIRWSNRMEDYRTELLGLMKTQIIKNSMIVPTGAKGSYIMKKNSSPLVEAGNLSAYSTFISGLLDLTDNIIDGKVVHPSNTLCYDTNDHYLVIAADKGTSSFSDIANSISQKYDFWLGDAFASGGSYGYDHKKTGITSKGAWLAAKSHFDTLNIDPHNSVITVIGIGDMSGDVFGNGLIQNKNIKLLAAFNHSHIFIDPTPDILTSYQERLRLFHADQSDWPHYKQESISEGGGIFSRNAKSIELTDAMRSMFQTTDKALTPDELIKHILCLNCDLLWNGGIGTYIKASFEQHSDAQDKNNDSVRVDANDLSVLVIAEGGNLGLTQCARVEYSKLGGRIYCDSIDNCAGVMCSDYEVNIKIGLSLKSDQALEQQQRNDLLYAMTDEVIDKTLSRVQRQLKCLSYESFHREAHVGEYLSLILFIDNYFNLNTSENYLYLTKNTLKNSNCTLTQPDLSVLISLSKNWLKDQLLQSNISNDIYYKQLIIDYFPSHFRNQVNFSIEHYPLQKEVICTYIANEIIDLAGICFISYITDIMHEQACTIAKAWYITSELFSFRTLLKNCTDHADNMSALHYIGTVSRTCVKWLLEEYSDEELDIPKTIKHFSTAFTNFKETCFDFTDINIISEQENMEKLLILLPSSKLSLQLQQPINKVFEFYFQTQTKLGFGKVYSNINSLQLTHYSDILEQGEISRELNAIHFLLCISLLECALSNNCDYSKAMQLWIKEHWYFHVQLSRMLQDSTELDSQQRVSFYRLLCNKVKRLLKTSFQSNYTKSISSMQKSA